MPPDQASATRPSPHPLEQSLHSMASTRGMARHRRSVTRGNLLASICVLAAAAVFGIMSISAPFSLIRRHMPIATDILMQLVSADFVMGDAQTVAKIEHNYARGSLGVGAHMLLGGAAMALCAVQFVPALRRRWPRLHRIVGTAAALGTAGAMVAAVSYLSITPAREILSGEPFAIALWTQAFATSYALGMAIWRIRQRHFRAHMGWMALLMVGLMTAPLLRVEDVLVGRLLPINLEMANAGLASILLPQTALLMCWWMTRVGRHDLPLLPAQACIPLPALGVIAWVGVLTAVHEGLLAPFGIDALAAWRPADAHLPSVAILWGIACAAFLPRLTGEIKRVQTGQPISAMGLGLLAASAIGAVLIGMTQPRHDVYQIAQQFFWVGWGAVGLATCAVGVIHRQAGSTHAPWRMLALFSGLTPGLWLPFGAALSLTGWPPSAVIASTLTVCWGATTWYGFASAFGLSLPGMPQATTPGATQQSESLAA